MAESTITSKGQITIPVEVRDALGLAAGTRVVFSNLPDGSVIMRAKSRSLEQIKGVLKEKVTKPKVSTRQMRIGRT